MKSRRPSRLTIYHLESRQVGRSLALVLPLAAGGALRLALLAAPPAMLIAVGARPLALLAFSLGFLLAHWLLLRSCRQAALHRSEQRT